MLIKSEKDQPVACKHIFTGFYKRGYLLDVQNSDQKDKRNNLPLLNRSRGRLPHDHSHC